jgi:hypothetical protein
VLGRVATEADEPGFVRVQRQFELAHSFLEIVKERPCLVLMLKADDGVIRIADHNHAARRLGEPPPQREGLEREDVRYADSVASLIDIVGKIADEQPSVAGSARRLEAVAGE